MEMNPKKNRTDVRNGAVCAAPRSSAPVLSSLLLRLTCADQAE